MRLLKTFLAFALSLVFGVFVYALFVFVATAQAWRAGEWFWHTWDTPPRVEDI